MIIKEIIERECCQRNDLKPLIGATKYSGSPEYMFCIHCGWIHKMHTFMDAAGSRDWEYRKVTPEKMLNL